MEKKVNKLKITNQQKDITVQEMQLEIHRLQEANQIKDRLIEEMKGENADLIAQISQFPVTVSSGKIIYLTY